MEAFDVIEYIGLGFLPRPIRLACRPLRFERGEEALHRRFVPHIAGAAHRADNAVVSHQPLEPLAGKAPQTPQADQEGLRGPVVRRHGIPN